MPGTISFDGLATGINTTDTVDKLMQVESRPKILKQAEQERLKNQVTAWQEVNSRLLSVQVAANDLSRLATWNTQSVSSSDDGILTATAGLGAPQGTYTLQVDSLARAHQVATPANPTGAPADPGYASADSLFGTGDLILSVGAAEHTFALDGTNNTLNGVAKTINDAKVGVTASVIYNGSGYQLMLASNKTGVENALSVDASGVDTTGARDLSSWTTVQEAADAQISLGSGTGKITVTSASNTVSTLIQGVTLNLRSALPGSDVTVTVSRSAENLTEKVQAFVDAYNEATAYISKQFAYDADQNVAGILMGDSTLLGVQRALGRMLTGSVANGSAYQALSTVGISTADDGTLAFDAAKFSDAVQDDYDGVMRLFRNGGSSTHTQVSFTYATSKTKEGTYAVEVTAPATRATLTGTSGPSLAVSDQNDQLTLSVDGGQAFTVTLNHGTYATAQELADEIQARVSAATSSKVTVGVDESGFLTLRSDRYGSASRISVDGSAVTNAGSDGQLGLSAGSAAGTDVQGTIHGEPATGNGQVLKGNAGNANTDGLQVLVQMDAPGTAELTFTRGLFSAFDEYLSDLTDPLLGAVGRREESINASLRDLTAQIDKMDERLDAKRQSLMDQFNRMEQAVGALNSQGNYLTNALSGLSANWKWNN